MKTNEVLLIIRQNLISWFKRFEYILLPVIRFILAFSILHRLENVTDYRSSLTSTLLVIGCALVGAFAPAEAIIVCAILAATYFICSFNIVLGMIIFFGLCLIYILYGRLFPKESLLIIIVLVAFSMKLEIMVPLIAALFGSYIGVVAILIGTVMWYILPQLMQALPAMTVNKTAFLDTVNAVLAIDYKGMLIDREMLVTCIIFFIVFTTVYIIRNLGVDYSAYIGILVGTVMNILGFVLAKIFFEDLAIELGIVIPLSVGFALIAVIVQFLAVVLDYQRAEMVNFEDDENYYYVKIVPKIQIAAKKRIKHVYTDKEHVQSNEQMDL